MNRYNFIFLLILYILSGFEAHAQKVLFYKHIKNDGVYDHYESIKRITIASSLTLEGIIWDDKIPFVGTLYAVAQSVDKGNSFKYSYLVLEINSEVMESGFYFSCKDESSWEGGGLINPFTVRTKGYPMILAFNCVPNNDGRKYFFYTQRSYEDEFGGFDLSPAINYPAKSIELRFDHDDNSTQYVKYTFVGDEQEFIQYYLHASGFK